MSKQNEGQQTKNFFLKKIFDFEITAQVVGEFIFFTILVVALSFLAYCQITTQLNNALEESVEKTTRTIAYELDKQFSFELDRLKTQAGYVEEGKLTPEELIQILQDVEGRQTGIVLKNGKTFIGNLPSQEIFWVAEDVFDGKPKIKYLHEIGLVFAIPIKIDGNECVLFNYYNDKAVRERFRTISYNGDGTVILLNSMNDWTIIADGVTLINTHPDMGDGWEKLGEKMGYINQSETKNFPKEAKNS